MKITALVTAASLVAGAAIATTTVMLLPPQPLPIQQELWVDQPLAHSTIMPGDTLITAHSSIAGTDAIQVVIRKDSEDIAVLQQDTDLAVSARGAGAKALYSLSRPWDAQPGVYELTAQAFVKGKPVKTITSTFTVAGAVDGAPVAPPVLPSLDPSPSPSASPSPSPEVSPSAPTVTPQAGWVSRTQADERYEWVNTFMVMGVMPADAQVFVQINLHNSLYPPYETGWKSYACGPLSLQSGTGADAMYQCSVTLTIEPPAEWIHDYFYPEMADSEYRSMIVVGGKSYYSGVGMWTAWGQQAVPIGA